MPHVSSELAVHHGGIFDQVITCFRTGCLSDPSSKAAATAVNPTPPLREHFPENTCLFASAGHDINVHHPQAMTTVSLPCCLMQSIAESGMTLYSDAKLTVTKEHHDHSDCRNACKNLCNCRDVQKAQDSRNLGRETNIPNLYRQEK